MRILDWLQAPALLAARLYVSFVFFNSGLQSLRDWAGTVWLYENEFHVALLPPHVAAVAGTAGELLLPPLLALGLCGRFGALGLFMVNAVALLSYLYALQAPAILFHVIWGILILVVALWGPGKWSVDHWLQRRRAA
jgi:putative oxidoreductase